MGNPATVNGLIAVTPDDDNDLPDGVTRGVYVGVAGDVTLISESGSTITLKNLAAGILHPIAVTRIEATGTTATDIVALY